MVSKYLRSAGHYTVLKIRNACSLEGAALRKSHVQIPIIIAYNDLIQCGKDATHIPQVWSSFYD